MYLDFVELLMEKKIKVCICFILLDMTDVVLVDRLKLSRYEHNDKQGKTDIRVLECLQRRLLVTLSK